MTKVKFYTSPEQQSNIALIPAPMQDIRKVIITVE